MLAKVHMAVIKPHSVRQRKKYTNTDTGKTQKHLQKSSTQRLLKQNRQITTTKRTQLRSSQLWWRRRRCC